MRGDAAMREATYCEVAARGVQEDRSAWQRLGRGKGAEREIGAAAPPMSRIGPMYLLASMNTLQEPL